MTTYENRRVSAGVLLLGSDTRSRPAGAVSYNSQLTALRSFHRLSDGLRTLFVANPDGSLVDLVDVCDFARANADASLPAPTLARYRPHALPPLPAAHISLGLTPNRELKPWTEDSPHGRRGRARW